MSGEGGIRTHEPPCGSYFLSREAPSTGLGHLSRPSHPSESLPPRPHGLPSHAPTIRGLASTFTTAHLLAAGEIAALLDIPDGYLQTCLIPVAYLRGDDLTPPARNNPNEIIAWNTWV